MCGGLSGLSPLENLALTKYFCAMTFNTYKAMSTVILGILFWLVFKKLKSCRPEDFVYNFAQQ